MSSDDDLEGDRLNTTRAALPANSPLVLPKRMWRSLVRVARFMAPIVLLGVAAEAAVRFGLINVPYLPAPSAVFLAIVRLLREPASGSGSSILWEHLSHSVVRAAVGFLVAAALGVILGILIGMKRSVKKLIAPLLTLMMPIPPIALAPLLIITLGRGDLTVMIIVWFAAFFPIVYSTMTGVATIDEKLIWVVRTMGARGAQVFTRVILPGSIPHVVTGLRLGLGLTWRALVAAEMVAVSDWGLGYMVFSARQYMAFEQMYAGILLLALGGLVTENLIVGYIEAKTLRKWGYLGQ